MFDRKTKSRARIRYVKKPKFQNKEEAKFGFDNREGCKTWDLKFNPKNNAKLKGRERDFKEEDKYWEKIEVEGNRESEEGCKHQKYSGFSLVELMIVIVIIGVLGGVAIPAYQDYVTKAKVARMMVMVEPAKLALAESIISGVDPLIEKLNNLDFIKEMKVENNAIIVTGDSAKLGLKPDKTLKITLTADMQNPGFVLWKCTAEPEDFKKFAPADCR